MAVPQNALSGSNNLGQIGEILRFRLVFSIKTDVTAGTAIAVPYGCAVSTEDLYAISIPQDLANVNEISA